MVSYEQTHRLCKQCGGSTMHYRRGTNHVLHFLITVLSCGWWALAWLCLSLKIGGWRCEKCGAGGWADKILVGAVAALGAIVVVPLAIGLVMAPSPAPSSLPPPRPDTTDLAGQDESLGPAAESTVEAESAEPVAVSSVVATVPEPTVQDVVPSTPVAQPEPEPEPEYEVYPAATVYSYYDANEIRGDRELKDKWFAVNGTIYEVSKDLLGTPYVCLRSREWIFGVQCMFPRSAESSLTELLPGQQVTIAGKCAGKMGNVLMRECRFYAPKPPATKQELRRAASRRDRKKPASEENAAEPAPAIRTWTDTSGEFTVEAAFVSYAAGQVRLRKADGSVIEIPMERLGEEDQRWIRQRGR